VQSVLETVRDPGRHFAFSIAVTALQLRRTSIDDTNWQVRSM